MPYLAAMIESSKEIMLSAADIKKKTAIKGDCKRIFSIYSLKS